MAEDLTLPIAIGSGRGAKIWKNTGFTFRELAERLANPTVSGESMSEYRRMGKADRSARKDVGGFVGGTVGTSRRRAASNIQSRTWITLDFDKVPVRESEAIASIESALRGVYKYIIYPTHSHTPEAPRLRVLIPLGATVTGEQYEPLARHVAYSLGFFDWVDEVSYRPAQLMYWPSVPNDLDYDAVFREDYTGEYMNGPEVLAEAYDGVDGWRDPSMWPGVKEDALEALKRAEKQGDPRERDNIVGEFCRAHDVYDVLDNVLQDVYTQYKDDRYTFTAGTAAGGLVVYEDGLFCFDHHSTSPTSGQLVNAFDLVRIHLYGDLDTNIKPGTATTKLPSYKSMEAYAVNDKGVKALRARERLERLDAIRDEFDFEEYTTTVSIADDEKAAQAQALEDKLSYDKHGALNQSISNARLILCEAPEFKGRIFRNELSGRDCVKDPLPWTPNAKGVRDLTDRDIAQLREYLEAVYGLTKQDAVLTGLINAAQTNSVHPLREYFTKTLEVMGWDGVSRLDALTQFLGAEPGEYARGILKLHCIAAVARIMSPGCKYDTMITLSGAQGIGKSTFISKLAGAEYFNDSITDFKGKDAYMLLMGNWHIELGELSAYRKSDRETFKQFMSKQVDEYRAPYGRTSERVPRQCVFWGTTNETGFLRDVTGERRTMPIQCGAVDPTLSVWDDLTPEWRNQFWAEIWTLYKAEKKNAAGVPYLGIPEDLRAAVEAARGEFKEENPMVDEVLSFLDVPILPPNEWRKLDLMERQDHIRVWREDPDAIDSSNLVLRDSVTAREVWVEGLGRELDEYINSKNIKDVSFLNSTLANAPGWKAESLKTPKKLDAKYGRISYKKRYVRR